jgi:hypothetical protein
MPSQFTTTRPTLGTHRPCGHWSCPRRAHRHSARTLFGTLWFTCRGR